MTVSSALLKVLIINENLWEGEDCGWQSVSEASKEQLDKFFKELYRDDEFIFENVTVIETAKAALDKLSEFKPDIIIIDCWGLERIKFDDFIEQLLGSLYKPKAIIPINIDVEDQKEILISAQNKHLNYTQRSPDSYSQLVNILESIHKANRVGGDNV